MQLGKMDRGDNSGDERWILLHERREMTMLVSQTEQLETEM